MPEGRPRVLILGGGFAGIGAVAKLEKADADVVLYDKHDYHTFQPLLYQVATDLLEPTTVGHPLRGLFNEQENARVHEASVTAIDLGARKAELAEGPPVEYDYLVLALGAEVNFFGTEGAPAHAFPMYTLADAIRLREHILDRWEAADIDHGLVEDGALNIVVVGGGPTGVESAGAIAELYRNLFVKDYPDLPQEQARIILVEASPQLFSMFKENLRDYTAKALDERGVELVLGAHVTGVTPTRVTLSSGDEIKAHTLVWGAGLQASPLTSSLGLELQRGKRIAVEPDLSIPGHPEAFAVGDIAWIEESGEVLPQLGSVALQSGQWAAENIARLLRGEQTKPFEYKDKGTMATIGRGAAVVQFRRGRTMKGRKASLAWGAVHLALLTSGEARAKAVIDWTWAGAAHERPGRITVRT